MGKLLSSGRLKRPLWVAVMGFDHLYSESMVPKWPSKMPSNFLNLKLQKIYVSMDEQEMQ